MYVYKTTTTMHMHVKIYYKTIVGVLQLEVTYCSSSCSLPALFSICTQWSLRTWISNICTHTRVPVLMAYGGSGSSTMTRGSIWSSSTLQKCRNKFKCFVHTHKHNSHHVLWVHQVLYHQEHQVVPRRINISHQAMYHYTRSSYKYMHKHHTVKLISSW